MKRIHYAFRQSVSYAIRHFNDVRYRDFVDECDFLEFLEFVDACDDPREIALESLLRLCDGSHRAIDKAILFAMVEYLDEVLPTDPNDSRATRLMMLCNRYPGDRHKYADWISLCYP